MQPVGVISTFVARAAAHFSTAVFTSAAPVARPQVPIPMNILAHSSTLPAARHVSMRYSTFFLSSRPKNWPFTIMAGAIEQQPRQATVSRENRPSFVVCPTSMPEELPAGVQQVERPLHVARGAPAHGDLDPPGRVELELVVECRHPEDLRGRKS